MPGTLSWLRDPRSKVSSHYLVTKDGRIFQLVREEDTAYAVGIVNRPDWPLYDGTNPNYYTLSIEHEALPGQTLTEDQYQATRWLHQSLIKRWNIPLDGDHIIGHYRLDSVNRKNDPGPGFPWKRQFADLKAYAEGSAPSPRPIKIRAGKKVISGLQIGNRSYAWVRELASALGRRVEWDQATRTAVVPPAAAPKQGSDGVTVAVGKVRVPALMLGQQAYVPVREFAEALGYEVIWNEATRTVNIV